MSIPHRPFTPAWWSMRLPIVQANTMTEHEFSDALEEQLSQATLEGYKPGEESINHLVPHSATAKAYRYNLPAITNRRVPHVSPLRHGMD